MHNKVSTQLATWLCLLALTVTVPVCHSAESKEQYGKVLFGQWDLPRDELQRMFDAKLSKPHMWRGPALELKLSGNPYTVVIKVTGTAKIDGEVGARWQAGLETNRGEMLFPVSGLTSKAKAGDTVVLTGVGTPMTLGDDRKAEPLLSPDERLRNMDLTEIQVSLYSGAAKATWHDYLPWLGLLGVMVVFGLWRVMFRRS